MDVRLTGTPVQPVLEVVSDYEEPLPGTRTRVNDWARSLKARWDAHAGAWHVNATHPHPPNTLLGNVRVAEYDVDETFDPSVDADDVYYPLVGVVDDRYAVIYPRFYGFEACEHILPLSARWEKGEGRFRAPLTDIVTRDGDPVHADLVVSDTVRQIAASVHATHAPDPDFPDPDTATAKHAHELATATNGDTLTDHDRERVPEWFGLNLYGYQHAGALAVADGHYLLADAPGVGKTRTSLAAAAVSGTQRLLIVVPPVVLTNWERETTTSNLTHPTGGSVVVVSAKKKQPELPATGVVIVADSLIVSRPALRDAICQWSPDCLIYDEAHRAKTWTSKRAETMRDIARHVTGPRICLTGTPVLNTTAELASILSITGHLDPVFTGVDAFMHTYCKRNRFRAWETRLNKVDQLKHVLDERVWVRRTKSDVLPDLPQKQRSTTYLDVDLKEYREAHAEVITTITEWLDTLDSPPTLAEAEKYARSSIGLVSPLRQAAGKAKIQAAEELITEHVANLTTDTEGRYESPLLVWAHHNSVITSLYDSLDAPCAVIDGATSTDERAEYVDAFQNGELAVLFCSISAAAVGITLTHGCDMIFVERDWTPALNTQAEDRMARVGQNRPVSIHTLIAVGTLDEQVARVLDEKADMLDRILTKGDNRVTDNDDAPASGYSTTTRIVLRLVETAMRKKYPTSAVSFS